MGTIQQTWLFQHPFLRSRIRLWGLLVRGQVWTPNHPRSVRLTLNTENLSFEYTKPGSRCSSGELAGCAPLAEALGQKQLHCLASGHPPLPSDPNHSRKPTGAGGCGELCSKLDRQVIPKKLQDHWPKESTSAPCWSGPHEYSGF